MVKEFSNSVIVRVSGITTRAFEQALTLFTTEARKMVGAHQTALSYVIGLNFDSGIHTTSFSDEYAEYSDWDVLPTGAGIWSLPLKEDVVIRMTDHVLKSHPGWKNFSDLQDSKGRLHPPMRGWLAVPVPGPIRGKPIGLLQATDKIDGSDFTEADEEAFIELVQIISPVFQMHQVTTTSFAATAGLERIRQIADSLSNPNG